MAAAAVKAMLTGVSWARAGHNAVLTDDVAAVLGRPPRTVDAWTRDALTRPGDGREVR
jgi:hypothetical protein